LIEMAQPTGSVFSAELPERGAARIGDRFSVAPSPDALAGYARLLRGVLDDLPWAVVVVEAGRRVALWNEELDALVPQTSGEPIHRDLDGLIRALRRLTIDPGEFERLLEQALDGSGEPREFEVGLVDGGALAIAVAPLRDGHDSQIICLRDATGELHARRELEHRALHDPLTSLPNRELLLDRLAVALARRVRQGTALGVIFIDLDEFKQINDEYGHVVGDEVLVSVAHRLQREVRDGDTVARYGGDEFVVLCEDLASEHTAEPLARRLARAVAQPVTAGGRLLEISASIGVVVEGDPATDPEALLARADAEMYRHKRRSARGTPGAR
jgi:diguanylate cyclase (GGDEF)-like protein